MTQKAVNAIIKNALDKKVSSLQQVKDLLGLLEAMNISSIADLSGVSLPESVKECHIRLLVAQGSQSFFSSLGEKVLAEASEITEIADGYELTLQSSAPKIKLNTASGTLVGEWGDQAYVQELSEELRESVEEALHAEFTSTKRFI